jgi:DNA-directed RNA polymerase omega subunit
MKEYDWEKLTSKTDSLYRTVILAARRASQVNRPDTRPLIATKSKKSTMIALDEIEQGKVTYRTGDVEDEFVE